MTKLKVTKLIRKTASGLHVWVEAEVKIEGKLQLRNFKIQTKNLPPEFN